MLEIWWSKNSSQLKVNLITCKVSKKNLLGTLLLFNYPEFFFFVCFYLILFQPFSFRIEIQYRHLLTLWQNRQWHVKQTLSSSEVLTNLKVLKSTDLSKVTFQCLYLSKAFYIMLPLKWDFQRTEKVYPSHFYSKSLTYLEFYFITYFNQHNPISLTFTLVIFIKTFI